MTKTPCIKCSRPILPTTAVKNNGLCMPCKRKHEYDIHIAPEKQKAQEQRALRLVDPWKHLWEYLIRCVQDPMRGFEGFSGLEKTYFAVELLDREVWSNGFTEFFPNTRTYIMSTPGLV